MFLLIRQNLSKFEVAYFWFLVQYSIFAGVLDMVSVGAGAVLLLGDEREILSKFNINQKEMFLVFALAFLVSSFARGFSTYLNAKFSYRVSAKLISKAINGLPGIYLYNMSKETRGNYIDILLVKMPLIAKSFLFPFLQLISGIVIGSVYLVITSIYYGASVAIIGSVVFVLYVATWLLMKRHLSKVAKEISDNQTKISGKKMALASRKSFFVMGLMPRVGCTGSDFSISTLAVKNLL